MREIREHVLVDYETPSCIISELEFTGVLCGSVNGIGDLDFIYDEEEKE